MSDIYGELSNFRTSVQSVDESMRAILTEIKGIRSDLQQSKNTPL